MAGPEVDELLPILHGHLTLLQLGEIPVGLEGRVDEWLAELVPSLSGWVTFAQDYILPGNVVSVEQWVSSTRMVRIFQSRCTSSQKGTKKTRGLK